MQSGCGVQHPRDPPGWLSMMSLIEDLRAIVGDKGLLVGDDVPEATMTDSSLIGTARPRALLRPQSIEEISQCLALCHAAGQSVVPQGGMTGFSAAAHARESDIALTLSRFAGIEALDTVSATVTVRAGTILETVQTACREKNLMFPVDFGARGSCQIGGMVATNAGGNRTIKYGNTRHNVLGLEVVLADGTVLSHLNEVTKDNTGLDLGGLFIGSEGTLGIITRVVFRLHPVQTESFTALCSLPTPQATIDFFDLARQTQGLNVFEVMGGDYFGYNEALEGHHFFEVQPEMVVLLESDTALEGLLETAFEAGLVEDAILPQSLSDIEKFWSVREAHRMDTSLPGLMNFDVSVPIVKMPEFVSRCKARVSKLYSNNRAMFYGHMGDGNLHIAIHTPDVPTSAYHETLHTLDAVIYDEVRRFGGSISAEHGIGLLKRDWLDHSRSAAEIALMRQIKSTVDPKGILNPGKVF